MYSTAPHNYYNKYGDLAVYAQCLICVANEVSINIPLILIRGHRYTFFLFVLGSLKINYRVLSNCSFWLPFNSLGNCTFKVINMSPFSDGKLCTGIPSPSTVYTVLG